VEASLGPAAKAMSKSKVAYVSAVEVKKDVGSGEKYLILHWNAVETGLPTKTRQDQNLHADWQLLIAKYQYVFPEEHPWTPHPRQEELKIELEYGAKPVSKPAYKLSPAEQDELKAQTELLLEKGLIRPSVSPWGAPVLFTPKKDGGLRMCLDYRVFWRMPVGRRGNTISKKFGEGQGTRTRRLFSV
jgi:hypothetical protein